MKKSMFFVATSLVLVLFLGIGSVLFFPSIKDNSTADKPPDNGLTLPDGTNPPNTDEPPEPDIPQQPETPSDPMDDYIAYKDKFVQALVNLKIRSGPSTDSAILGTLYPEQTLKCLKFFALLNWYEVDFNGAKAYVSANELYSALINYQPPPTYEATAKKIIDAGYKLLGIPYQYGAQRLLFDNGTFNSAFTGSTFDCSSFIQYIYYKGSNIKLSTTSRSQSLQGTYVSHSNLRKGDLIFMWSSSREDNVGIERIGHVAMYIGDNKIMHTYGTGGVVVQTYSDSWRERFITAKRFF